MGAAPYAREMSVPIGMLINEKLPSIRSWLPLDPSALVVFRLIDATFECWTGRLWRSLCDDSGCGCEDRHEQRSECRESHVFQAFRPCPSVIASLWSGNKQGSSSRCCSDVLVDDVLQIEHGKEERRQP